MTVVGIFPTGPRRSAVWGCCSSMAIPGRLAAALVLPGAFHGVHEPDRSAASRRCAEN
jgi:hypothetical protein